MIPGFIVSILTFPGVIVHEMAHLMMCRIVGVKVHKVCYFRFGNPAGYVIHEMPQSAWASILIGIGPLFINTILGALLGGPFIGKETRVANPSLIYVLIWLGISVAMHSFPSTGDAKAIWSAVWSKGAPVLTKIVGTPLVVLIWIGALGSMLWLDVLYGVGVVYATGILFFGAPLMW